MDRRHRPWLRRCLAGAAVAVALSGCQEGMAPRATAHARATSAATSAAAAAAAVPADFPMPIVRPVRVAPPPLTLPDGTRRLFPRHRVVAYYGAAGAPVLGVLGTAGPEQVWPALHRQARAYHRRGTRILPAYELITFVATGSRGGQGNYSTRIPDATIARYARAARRHGALLILDIQPGRGSFLADAKSLRRWLRLPYVALGIDPEWKLYGGEMPLSRIGHTTAHAVNRVSRWLNRLTVAERLPQKLMLVHEFTDEMVLHKQALRHRRHLAIVFNVDGFGSRAAKLGKYADFARHRRFRMGFKLFYDADIDLLPPRAVLRMRPAPWVVEYQ